jgi:SAM-dependent methyltransferase
MSVIWHDLECGGYVEDLHLWRELAERYGDPVLDVGAGTGRISLDLARHGHAVTALDHDPSLLAELRRRASGVELTTVLADARDFALGAQFALCVMPMQTIQLLGGADGRAGFLRCAHRHLRAGGLLAIALTDELEIYEVPDGSPVPLPDICERDGVVYSSQPTAVRADSDGFVLERRRETVSADGRLVVSRDAIRLDRLDAAGLEHEAAQVGLTPAGRSSIPATVDYVGSAVVMLSA